MITALANLGCRASNMERISGYLTASIPQLPPDQQAAMHNEALAEYAQIKGYPPSVLTKQGAFDMDMDFSTMMERGGGAGLTLSMVKCWVPCDHVPVRSWPLFRARQLMRDVIESFKQDQAL